MKPEPTTEEFADFPDWPYAYRTVVKRKVRGTKVEKAVIVLDTGTKIKPRQRHFFTTVDDARKKAKVMAKELKDGGRHNFSDQSDRFDALNALRLLRDRKAKETLTEAVLFLLERKYPKGGDAFVKDLATEFIREKDLIRKLSKTYKTSFHRIQVFGETFVKPQSDPKKDPESYRCSEVTVEQVLDYIYAHKTGSRRRAGNITGISGCCSISRSRKGGFTRIRWMPSTNRKDAKVILKSFQSIKCVYW